MGRRPKGVIMFMLMFIGMIALVAIILGLIIAVTFKDKSRP